MSKGKQNKKKSGNGAGIITFGIGFALISLLFHPHSLVGFILTLAFSGTVGSLVRSMAQGLDLTTKEQKAQKAQQEKQQQEDNLQKVKSDTGNPEVDALLNRGRETIKEIREENARIPDESLTAKLNQLESQCAEIFRAVYDKPAKASQIRKFMDYYLPTTLKMVKSYRVLGERNLSSPDIIAARNRIDDALGVVLKGCQNMLDNLYKDDVLDITTDIDVLEQMMKRDGLMESDLEKAAEQAKQAARIDMAAQAMKAQRTAAQQTVLNTPTAQVQPVAQTQYAAQTQPAVQAQPSVQAQPVPTLQTDSGVRREVDNAAAQSAQHIPQVPTIDGGMYPAYGDQAQAVAQKPQK